MTARVMSMVLAIAVFASCADTPVQGQTVPASSTSQVAASTAAIEAFAALITSYQSATTEADFVSAVDAFARAVGDLPDQQQIEKVRVALRYAREIDPESRYALLVRVHDKLGVEGRRRFQNELQDMIAAVAFVDTMKSLQSAAASVAFVANSPETLQNTAQLLPDGARWQIPSLGLALLTCTQSDEDAAAIAIRSLIGTAATTPPSAMSHSTLFDLLAYASARHPTRLTPVTIDSARRDAVQTGKLIEVAENYRVIAEKMTTMERDFGNLSADFAALRASLTAKVEAAQREVEAAKAAALNAETSALNAKRGSEQAKDEANRALKQAEKALEQARQAAKTVEEMSQAKAEDERPYLFAVSFEIVRSDGRREQGGTTNVEVKRIDASDELKAEEIASRRVRNVLMYQHPNRTVHITAVLRTQ